MGKEELGEDGEATVGESWWLEQALREIGSLGCEEKEEAEHNGGRG
jgi:hypothetical protein